MCSLPRGRVAAFVVVTAVGLASAPARAEQQSAPPLTIHGPIQVKRLDDGSLARGPRNQFISSNWSGYAIAHYQSGQSYTSAQATWVLPAVTWGPTTSNTSEEYSATWVGIGGFCLNALCTRANKTLIQLGTAQYVSSSGVTSYSAWYEMLPQSPVNIPITVSPGDQITASLQCVSACSAKTQVWQLSIKDITTGYNWSQNFNYSSSLASADWIEEAPYSGGVLPLANFNVAGISPSAPSLSTTSLTSANAIQMSDPWGQTSNPSSTDQQTITFDTCWGYGSMAPCSTP